MNIINPLNAKLNPIYHLLALLGTHLILHVSRVRVNVHEIYTKSFVSTYLLPIYKLGVLHYNIINEYYITWPTLVTQKYLQI